LRDGLKALNSGAAQKILNGCESPFLLRDVLGIDCGQLLQGNTLSAQTVCIIDALFNVLNEVFADQRPTLLVLEEAWLYLKHPLFQAKLSDWLKTLRKSNVAVVLVSQEVADIANSPLQSVIQSACMTRIYCPNRAAQEIEIAKGYQAFGLTPDEVALIANLVPKQEYYYHSPEGAQVFQLDLGDTAKALLCQTNKVNREYLETLLSQQALCELMDWFESEGLTLGHEFLRNTEWGNFRYWMAESAADEGDYL
jgi:type IV secretion system protein TrbE